MPKTKAPVVISKKNSMVMVMCPKKGEKVWANVGPKRGPVCTHCSGTGHDVVKS